MTWQNTINVLNGVGSDLLYSYSVWEYLFYFSKVRPRLNFPRPRLKRPRPCWHV